MQNYSKGQILTMQAMNAPRRRAVCMFFVKVSQNVTDVTGDMTGYTNTYNYCGKLKKRLVTRSCINCKLYKPKTDKP